MQAITLSSKGNFNKTRRFLNKASRLDSYLTQILNKYGELGVQRLSEYTPKRTGLTASSWTYTVNVRKGSGTIEWWNTNENNGVPIALIIQYGHGTRNGGYVQGIDYINPALQPIFEELAKGVWEEVTNG